MCQQPIDSHNLCQYKRLSLHSCFSLIQKREKTLFSRVGLSANAHILVQSKQESSIHTQSLKVILESLASFRFPFTEKCFHNWEFLQTPLLCVSDKIVQCFSIAHKWMAQMLRKPFSSTCFVACFCYDTWHTKPHLYFITKVVGLGNR